MDNKQDLPIMLDIVAKRVCVAKNHAHEFDVSSFGQCSISARDTETGAIVFPNCQLMVSNQKPGDLVIVNTQGNFIQGNKDQLPSDYEVHLRIYKNSKAVNSIVQSKGKYASWFSQLHRDIEFKQYDENGTVSKKTIAKYCDSGFLQLKSIMDSDTCGVLIDGKGLFMWDVSPWKCLEKLNQIEERGSLYLADSVFQEKGVPSVVFPPENSDRREKGNEIPFEMQRRLVLDLLVYFDKVCRNNNIKYSITGGTLLGAVRHGGFIPWDDDADVFLTRPEYNRLIEIFPEHGRYRLYNRQRDGKYQYSFSRLIDTFTLITDAPNTFSKGKGIFIDICVVDGLPKYRMFRNAHIRLMHLLMACRSAFAQNLDSDRYRRHPIKRMLKKFVRTFSCPDIWNKLIDKHLDRFSFNHSEYVGNFTSQYGKKELMHKSVFDSYFELDFEGHGFMVCKGYEEYLSNVYGDFMRLPPPEKRKRKHPNTAIWVNCSKGGDI